MILRNTHCVHCGSEMESKRASKKYCSDACRLFQFRETSDKPTANKKRRKNEMGLIVSSQTKKENPITIAPTPVVYDMDMPEKFRTDDEPSQYKQPERELSRTEIMKLLKKK